MGVAIIIEAALAFWESAFHRDTDLGNMLADSVNLAGATLVAGVFPGWPLRCRSGLQPAWGWNS
jgi:ABC-type dipeptide/oligopeptide/nickel transport system permease subunit